jgi:hypothetical protein
MSNRATISQFGIGPGKGLIQAPAMSNEQPSLFLAALAQQHRNLSP